jgi:tetratricopeptide (TPR) repeat protein
VNRLVLVLVLVLAPLTRAQDEPLDADPRPLDRIWLTGNDDPIECEIQESPDPSKIVYKKKGNTITVDRTQVARELHRQTPLDALKERAERIKAGTPEEHRKLGDWAWRQGLEPEALVELRKSVQAATDPQASIPFRARLARLLVARANHLDGDAREDVWDELFKLGKKCEKLNAVSPEVQLGLARALLAQGIAPPAIPYLEKAQGTLAQAAAGPPVVEDPKVAPLVKEDPKPVVKDPPKKEDAPKGDGTRPVRRGDRNGADPNGNPPKAPPVKQEAVPLEDHAQEKWPGIPADRRLVYRDVLLSLGEAYMKTDRPTDAVTALGPVIECWPQDKAGLMLRAQAKVLTGDAKGAVSDLGPAIAAYPEDASLLRDRGIASYAAGDLDAARVDLEKSLALGIDDPRPVQAHLGLVHLRAGRFPEAKTAFDAASSGGAYGLAKLGLGLLAELQGHPEDALALYDEARPLLEQDGLVSYSLALARIKANKLDDAQQAARVALKEGLPFPSGARTLAAVARAKGDAKTEVRILEELVGSGVRASADDLYALGRAYATADRLDDARLVFDRAIALVATHVPALLGAGYVRYAADDREIARDFFQRALVAANPDPAAPPTPEVFFAKRALKNLEDARTRRVWIDRFDQDEGDVKNGWTVHAGYGVDVSVKGKKLVFDGTQKSEVDGGKTRISRELPGQTIVKFEARLDLSKARDARAGIRFETDKGNAIVFRDKDELFMATANQGPQITEDKVKIGAWPKDDRPHVLAIEIEDVGASLVSFWLDGDRLGNPVKIGTMGRATKPSLSVFAAATAGTALVAVAEEVRIYALRPQASSKSGGN